MDILANFLANVPYTVLAGVGAGVLRNIAGWIENALKDGKVEKYEYKELAGTIIKYVTFVSLLSLGLPIDQSIVATLSLDVGASAIKKAGNRK